MTLQDVYDALEVGELRQHTLFSDGLAVENYPKVNRAINDGLINLYGRFPLKFRQLTLMMSGHITHYYFRKEHAVTDTTLGVEKYIDDSVYNPFTGDLAKVFSVQDEGGCDVPLNDKCSCYGVFTPSNESLIISNPIEGDSIFITYQARHPKVESDSRTNMELEIPLGLVPALYAYVGHRLYSGSTDATALNKANGLLSQYELLCSQQDMFGLTNRDDGTPNQIFETEGLGMSFPKKPCSNAGLVSKYIGSAYDTVKTVADAVEDVTTVANNITDVNKVVTNIDDIKDVADSITEYRVTESFVLVKGQMVINTSKVIVSACTISINSQLVDAQELFRDRDYKITGTNQITMLRSYPVGSGIKISQYVYKDDIGDLDVDAVTFDAVTGMLTITSKGIEFQATILAGATGSFTTNDGKTITVVNGLIKGID